MNLCIRIINQQFNNNLYTPGKMEPTLRFKALNSFALSFIKKLSTVRRLFKCGSNAKILTFCHQLSDHTHAHAGTKLTFLCQNP